MLDEYRLRGSFFRPQRRLIAVLQAAAFCSLRRLFAAAAAAFCAAAAELAAAACRFFRRPQSRRRLPMTAASSIGWLFHQNRQAAFSLPLRAFSASSLPLSLQPQAASCRFAFSFWRAAAGLPSAFHAGFALAACCRFRSPPLSRFSFSRCPPGLPLSFRRAAAAALLRPLPTGSFYGFHCFFVELELTLPSSRASALTSRRFRYRLDMLLFDFAPPLSRFQR